MKINRYLITLTLLLSGLLTFGQGNVVISTGFDGYTGTIATVPTGWFISFNNSGSFYASTGNFGVSAPSYKFGNDSDYITTPGYPAMDSVSFFVKGNGGPFSPDNALMIYQSQDSSNWNLIEAIDSLPTTGTTLMVQLQGDPYLKFVYHKVVAGGNIAFDDVKIYSSAVIGLQQPKENNTISIYPTLTNGPVAVNVPNGLGYTKIEVFDILGNRVNINPERTQSYQYALNLKGMRQGFYFVRIQTGKQVVTKRITLTEQN